MVFILALILSFFTNILAMENSYIDNKGNPVASLKTLSLIEGYTKAKNRGSKSAIKKSAFDAIQGLYTFEIPQDLFIKIGNYVKEDLCRRTPLYKCAGMIDEGHTSGISALCVDSENNRILAGSLDHYLLVSDLSTKKPVTKIDFPCCVSFIEKQGDCVLVQLDNAQRELRAYDASTYAPMPLLASDEPIEIRNKSWFQSENSNSPLKLGTAVGGGINWQFFITLRDKNDKAMLVPCDVTNACWKIRALVRDPKNDAFYLGSNYHSVAEFKQVFDYKKAMNSNMTSLLELAIADHGMEPEQIPGEVDHCTIL